MTERRSSVLSRVVAVCALAPAVAALVLSDAFDAEAASAVLVRANADLLVALLPFALVLVVDAVAWGIALDWAVWGVLPDAIVYAGAAIVVASGVFLVHRERVHLEAEHP